MLVVRKFAPAWGLADLSPFVVKVETWLRLAKVPYEARPGDPRKTPKGKLPILEDGDVTVADSRFIVDHVTRTRGVTLDAALTPGQRAIATAFQSMVEEQLYFVMVHQRWQLDSNWPKVQPVVVALLKGAGAPGPLAALVTKRVRAQMIAQARAQGTGRHAPDEVGAIGRGIVDALATQIGDGPYFFGAAPTTIDATAYAFLSGILDAPIEGPLRDAADARPNLRAYVDRIKASYWA